MSTRACLCVCICNRGNDGNLALCRFKNTFIHPIEFINIARIHPDVFLLGRICRMYARARACVCVCKREIEKGMYKACKEGCTPVCALLEFNGVCDNFPCPCIFMMIIDPGNQPINILLTPNIKLNTGHHHVLHVRV